MKRNKPWLAVFLGLVFTLLPLPLLAQEILLKGRVTDPQGNGLPAAVVQVASHDQVLARTTSGPDGLFQLKVHLAGEFVIKVEAAGFRPVTRTIAVRGSGNPEIQINMGQLASRIENVTVTADVNEVDVMSPDPAEKIFVRQEAARREPRPAGSAHLDSRLSNRDGFGRHQGAQYFAPGVAADHGEPIAQYIAVGSYLVPNNLSANAQGNGCSDPNIFNSHGECAREGRVI